MTFPELRALFPSAARCIHLNHAGTSPIARPVAEAVGAVTDELMSEDPFLAYKNHQRRQEGLRDLLGRMMSVSPDTLAFVRNTSHGLTIAADSLPFEAGDNVVLPGIEYPANVYPWMAQAQRGVETRRIPPRAGDRIAEEDLMAACDTRTRALSVSWVQWGTGQRLDLAVLGAFCRERDILFVVDIVQGLGALRLDLSRLPVDIATAGCHKWLLAPGGLGVLYVRADVMNRLRLTNIGWNSVTNAVQWERIHFDLRPEAARFEEGTPNLLGTAALYASVSLLEAAGFDAVEKHVLDLADKARDLLAERGCRIISPAEPAVRSGIVAFHHPSLSNDAALAALAARGVIAAVRCGNLRFSPHVENDGDDIEKAVAAL